MSTIIVTGRVVETAADGNHITQTMDLNKPGGRLVLKDSNFPMGELVKITVSNENENFPLDM